VTMPILTWLLLLALTGREHWRLGAGALLTAPLLYAAKTALRRPGLR